MGLRIVTKDIKVWYYKSGFEDFTLERKYYAYKGIIKKAACSDGTYRVRNNFNSFFYEGNR